MALLIVAAISAALLEGGTMGLLGLAVSVLVGEFDLATELIKGRLGTSVDEFLENTSASGLFLLLVGVAVVTQFAKSIFLYVSQVIEIIIAYDMKREIQRESVGQLMAMSYGQVSQYSPGELAIVIDQSDVVAEGVGKRCPRNTDASCICHYYVGDVSQDDGRNCWGCNPVVAVA